MTSKFQIIDDIKFIHDEVLLEKAESFSPPMRREEIKPLRIAELVEDTSKLNDWGVTESVKDIKQLKKYEFTRNDCLIIDFGDHRVGSFQINLDKKGSPQDAPLYLRVKFAEVPAELAVESSDYDGWLSRSWIQEEFVHVDELPFTLNFTRRYSFRYVELKVIDTSPKWAVVFSNPFVITESSADYSKLPNVDMEDPVLQRIYDVGVKTLAECMQDVFEDGPKRDRRLWLGDLRLQALANYATFDSVDLVKRCLYLFAGMTTEEGKIPADIFVKPNYIPDDTFLFEYSLFFISTLYDLHQAHPVPELVRELYPTAKKQMDITLSMFDDEGKLVPNEDYPIFVDWSNDFNKDTAGQAEAIYVLKQFIALAKETGEKNIEYYRSVLDKISAYARETLYDSKKKLFATAGEEYNIASQVWMVLAHVMTDAENREIMENMIDRLFPVNGIATPYMYHHIVEALFEAGLKEDAVKLMKNYWGKMIGLGADTYWETFDPDHPEYSPYGSPVVNSYCHAWSCTPVYLIRKYCM